jgi:hypothetical protein
VQGRLTSRLAPALTPAANASLIIFARNAVISDVCLFLLPFLRPLFAGLAQPLTNVTAIHPGGIPPFTVDLYAT